LVEITCETDFVARTDVLKEFGHNIAMHIAAATPISIDVDSIPTEIFERETRIYNEQVRDSGKPDKIKEAIIRGKIKKFVATNCLLNQAYVKDTTMNVEDYLDEIITLLDENIVIRRFVRFELGE